MKNKTKKILAGACLGLVGMGCLAGCEKKQDNYELTVINDSQYGIISPVLDNETNSVIVDRGDDYTFTITPREGYEIKNLLIDGKLVDANSVYTFTDIESDHSIGAVYSRTINSYSIVGMKFNIEYINDNDYIKEVNDLELKLRIIQADTHGKFMGDSDIDITLTEFTQETLYISKNFVSPQMLSVSDDSDIKDFLKLKDYSADEELHLPIEYGANITIDFYSNGQYDHMRALETGYYSYGKIEKNNFKEIKSIYEGLYEVCFEFHDNCQKIETVDGKSLKISNISFICKANY